MSYHWKIAAILALFLSAGLALYGAGTVVETGDALNYGEILQEVGLAIVIAAGVALGVDLFVHSVLLGSVDRSLEELHRGSDVLKGTAELGIQDVLGRKGATVERQRAELRIQEAIKKQISTNGGQIKFLCDSAADLLCEGTSVGDAFWSSHADLSSKCKLRVLLLCPESQAAHDRQSLETGQSTISNITRCADYLTHLAENITDKSRVDFRCYEDLPAAFLIITDEYAFIEGYPSCLLAPGDGPSDGVSPMFVVKSNSQVYERWNGHFENIWSSRSEDYLTHEH